MTQGRPITKDEVVYSEELSITDLRDHFSFYKGSDTIHKVTCHGKAVAVLVPYHRILELLKEMSEK